MSDGPHKSLPMPKAWRELAKRGDQLTYESSQVADALPAALESDWKNEVSGRLISALKDVFSGRDNSLRLPEIALSQLEAIKVMAAGSVFGINAVSWCIQLVNEGRLDAGALYEAVGMAAKERGYAGVRQVEEHYFREASERRSVRVRDRLEGALSGVAVSHLGSRLIDPKPSQSVTPRKMTELSDGVLL